MSVCLSVCLSVKFALIEMRTHLQMTIFLERGPKVPSRVFHLWLILFTLFGFFYRVSFRCGIFFPDPDEVDPAKPTLLPYGPLLIFNGSWAAPECPSNDVSRFNDFCDSIVIIFYNYWQAIIPNMLQMKPFSDRLFLTDPSLIKKNADKGKSIGDDICW